MFDRLRLNEAQEAESFPIEMVTSVAFHEDRNSGLVWPNWWKMRPEVHDATGTADSAGELCHRPCDGDL